MNLFNPTYVMLNREKSIIRFNHISDKLSSEDVEMLKSLYEHYHMMATCYQWQFKRLSRINLTLNMSAIFLTVTGGAFSALGGLATLSISAIGLLMHGYIKNKKIAEKVSQCEVAYKSYTKSLNTIKGYLRGIEFDKSTMFSNLTMVDNIINDSTMPLEKKIKDRYTKVYRGHVYMKSSEYYGGRGPRGV